MPTEDLPPQPPAGSGCNCATLTMVLAQGLGLAVGVGLALGKGWGRTLAGAVLGVVSGTLVVIAGISTVGLGLVAVLWVRERWLGRPPSGILGPETSGPEEETR